jgi:elongation factor Ts
MAITAKMVSELRDVTGAAMMNCKKALEATNGDFQAAIDHLRKQGLKAAEKKSDRATAQGRVFTALSADGRRGHLGGLACETDFLASSDGFKALVASLEAHVRAQDPDGIEGGKRPILGQSLGGKSVAEALQAAIGQFGENVRLTDLVRVESREGFVGSYVHHDNRQGAIAAITTSAPAAKAAEALKSLCQHIVVFAPVWTRREDVPADAVEHEKSVLAESDEVKSKPEAMREKVVMGRLNNFFAERVLSEQPWVLEPKLTVQKALEKELGGAVRIEAFGRVKLGG